MDEPGPSDPGVAQGLTHRFYPYGTACPGCGYSMAGSRATSCPECGAVTNDLAYPGLERPISDRERGSAREVRFAVSPWAVIAASSESINPLVGVLVLFAILGFVVFPILRSVDQMQSPLAVIVRAAASGAVVLGGFAIVHGATTWWRLRRASRRRHAALADDLAEGRVEEYLYEPTHAMVIGDEAGECLLLRFYGGSVFGMRPEAMRRLGLAPDAAVGQRARLAMLPRSRVLVGVYFDGPGIPTSRRPDLRLRRVHPGAGDPVLAARAIGFLVHVRHGARPPFAPDGPSTQPSAR